MPARAGSLEVGILELAARQHGVVSRAQLLDLGLTATAVRSHVRAGRLRPVHRGVYLLGPLRGDLVPAHAREMAAALAAGPHAAVSHRSAGLLWGILDPPRRPTPVEVTVAGSDRGRRGGIRPHRVAVLPRTDVTTLDGIPLTTPARTLVDLAGALRARALERALARTWRRELTDPSTVASRLRDRGPVAGSAMLRRLLAGASAPALTRSEAEARLLHLVRRAELPPPATNVLVRGLEVDFLWREEGVAVEVDGFAYHSSRQAFERDRARDARLAAAGLTVVRITWRQLTDEPLGVLGRLARTLGAAGRRP